MVLSTVLLLLGAGAVQAFYNPQTGRWLSRDPLADEAFLRDQVEGKAWRVKQRLSEQAKLPSYLFVGNNPESKVDFLGLAATTFYWSAPICGAGYETAFIQVGLGGSFLYNKPFVDDGKHGQL